MCVGEGSGTYLSEFLVVRRIEVLDGSASAAARLQEKTREREREHKYIGRIDDDADDGRRLTRRAKT